MRHKFELLISGRAAGLDTIAQLFVGHPRVEVVVRQLPSGERDPFAGVAKIPDGAVIVLSGAWREELEMLSLRPTTERPPMVVIGPHEEAAAMRLAMRAGAHDFLPSPPAGAELLSAVERMVSERRALERQSRGMLAAVINAKGGSGASTIAANAAHLLATHCGRRAALVDLDLQFGSLPTHFDMTGGEGVVEALARIDSLDALAIEGYMLRHPSGLHLLAGTLQRTRAPDPGDETRLVKLFDLLLSSYEQVVADLPRLLGPATLPVLHSADTVLVVTQQSVAHLRDAKQLVAYLVNQLGITSDRLWVVVNRYDKRLPITTGELAEVLRPGRLITLRNDYARVAASIDLGVPLFETARSAHITRELMALVEGLPRAIDAQAVTRAGFAQRLFRWAWA